MPDEKDSKVEQSDKSVKTEKPTVQPKQPPPQEPRVRAYDEDWRWYDSCAPSRQDWYS